MALFERTQIQPWVDARQFRIDFKDQRETIRALIHTGFILTTQEPEEQYRPALAALPLIESNAARLLLRETDRFLRYLERQYEAGCGQKLSVDQIAQDLHVSQETALEVLRYIVDTPVAGPRTTGFPNSLDWGLTPTEKSLDYPDINALLDQLARWMVRRESPATGLVYPHGAAYQQLPSFARSTLTDQWISRIKNNPIAAILLALMFVVGILSSGLEDVRELIATVLSLSWTQSIG